MGGLITFITQHSNTRGIVLDCAKKMHVVNKQSLIPRIKQHLKMPLCDVVSNILGSHPAPESRCSGY